MVSQLLQNWLKTKDLTIRGKAYNAPKNLNVNAENQGKFKTYEVFPEGIQPCNMKNRR